MASSSNIIPRENRKKNVELYNTPIAVSGDRDLQPANPRARRVGQGLSASPLQRKIMPGVRNKQARRRRDSAG